MALKCKEYLIIQANYLSTGATAHELANLICKYSGAVLLYNETKRIKWKISAKQWEEELQFFVNNKRFKDKL